MNREDARILLAAARVLVNRGDAEAKLSSKKEGRSMGLGVCLHHHAHVIALQIAQLDQRFRKSRK